MAYISIKVSGVLVCGLLALTSVKAADIVCIDEAADSKQLEACTVEVLPKKQDDAIAEYARLARIYAGDAEMLEILRLAKEGHQDYLTWQCMFETVATAGTTDKKLLRLSLKAEKAFMHCVARVADDAVSGMKRIAKP
jgi:hypothetical protein